MNPTLVTFALLLASPPTSASLPETIQYVYRADRAREGYALPDGLEFCADQEAPGVRLVGGVARFTSDEPIFDARGANTMVADIATASGCRSVRLQFLTPEAAAEARREALVKLLSADAPPSAFTLPIEPSATKAFVPEIPGSQPAFECTVLGNCDVAQDFLRQLRERASKPEPATPTSTWYYATDAPERIKLPKEYFRCTARGTPQKKGPPLWLSLGHAVLVSKDPNCKETESVRLSAAPLLPDPEKLIPTLTALAEDGALLTVEHEALRNPKVWDYLEIVTEGATTGAWETDPNKRSVARARLLGLAADQLSVTVTVRLGAKSWGAEDKVFLADGTKLERAKDTQISKWSIKVEPTLKASASRADLPTVVLPKSSPLLRFLRGGTPSTPEGRVRGQEVTVSRSQTTTLRSSAGGTVRVEYDLGEVRVGGKAKVSLEVSTKACDYTFDQLTRAYSGLDQTYAVVRIKADNECLFSEFEVGSKDGLSFGPMRKLEARDLYLLPIHARKWAADKTQVEIEYAPRGSSHKSKTKLTLDPFVDPETSTFAVRSPLSTKRSTLGDGYFAAGKRNWIQWRFTDQARWKLEIENTTQYISCADHDADRSRTDAAGVSNENPCVVPTDNASAVTPLSLGLERAYEPHWSGAQKNVELSSSVVEKLRFELGKGAKDRNFALPVTNAQLYCDGYRDPKVVFADDDCHIEWSYDAEQLRQAGDQTVTVEISHEGTDGKFAKQETSGLLRTVEARATEAKLVISLALDSHGGVPARGRRMVITFKHEARDTDLAHPKNIRARERTFTLRRPTPGLRIERDGGGFRLTFGALGGTAYRFPADAGDAERSSQVDPIAEIEFKGGLGLTLEEWDFARGERALLFNPQLVAAAFLKPNDRFFASFAVGLGIRIFDPLAAGSVSTETSLAAMVEVGYDDRLSAALLFALNLTLGWTPGADDGS